MADIAVMSHDLEAMEQSALGTVGGVLRRGGGRGSSEHTVLGASRTFRAAPLPLNMASNRAVAAPIVPTLSRPCYIALIRALWDAEN